MTEQREPRDRDRGNVGDEVREGIRAGIGILSAIKDAVEETIQDMANRGELSQDRAREAVRTTMDRAQMAFDDARVRFDFVPRREFEALRAEVADLRSRIARHETAGHAPQGGAAPGTPPGPGATDASSAGDIPVSEG
jgi:polyhydroxyalkanoate synthesis regulator phasin